MRRPESLLIFYPVFPVFPALSDPCTFRFPHFQFSRLLAFPAVSVIASGFLSNSPHLQRHNSRSDAGTINRIQQRHGQPHLKPRTKPHHQYVFPGIRAIDNSSDHTANSVASPAAGKDTGYTSDVSTCFDSYHAFPYPFRLERPTPIARAPYQSLNISRSSRDVEGLFGKSLNNSRKRQFRRDIEISRYVEHDGQS